MSFTRVREQIAGDSCYLQSGCEGQGVGVEVCEPAGEVELASGEVAGGDEAEDGVLEIRVELDEGVASAGAGDGLQLVKAEAVVEGDGRRRGVGFGLAGADGEAGVEAGGGVMRAGIGEEQGDGLKCRELGRVEVLGDVKGSAVDEALQPDGWRRVRCSEQRSCSQLFGVGHDTTLLLFRALHIKTSLDTDWTLGDGGKAEK
jgi:hypothetical protein